MRSREGAGFCWIFIDFGVRKIQDLVHPDTFLQFCPWTMLDQRVIRSGKAIDGGWANGISRFAHSRPNTGD